MTPADTSLGTIVLWVAALSTIISFASVIWTIFSGPARRNGSRLDAHATRLDAHEMRLSGIDQTLRTIPGKQDLHDLEVAMTRLQGEMQTMSQIMTRLESLVSRHEDHLLKK